MNARAVTAVPGTASGVAQRSDVRRTVVSYGAPAAFAATGLLHVVAEVDAPTRSRHRWPPPRLDPLGHPISEYTLKIKGG